MIKVAHILNNLGKGGAQRSTLDIIKSTDTIYDNYLILLEDEQAYSVESVKIYALTKNKKIYKKLDIIGDYLLSRKLSSLLKTLGIDCAISHVEVAAKVLHFVDIKKIYFIRTNITKELERIKKRSYFRYMKKKYIYKKIMTHQHLFTVSYCIEKKIKKYIISKSITTVYTPFDFDKIQALSTMDYQKQNEEYLLFCSGNRREKRFDILLQAFEKIQNKNIKLVVLGVNKDEIKTSKEISSRIKFLEFQPNPYPYIKNAKLLILSSEQEGLPRVLVEALSLKTPIVSTDCECGPKEIMQGELAPYLALVNDSNNLAQKIDLALNTYPCITDLMINKFKKERNIGIYQKKIDTLCNK